MRNYTFQSKIEMYTVMKPHLSNDGWILIPNSANNLNANCILHVW